jgi:acetyl-CoA hydrolase
LTVGPADYVSPAMDGHLRINTMFISANIRRAIQEGRGDFTPVLLSEFTLLFKNGHLPVDIALVHLSPPDNYGFCSFGIEVGLTKSPAESAKIIIAEVNQQMPEPWEILYPRKQTRLYRAGQLPLPEMSMGGEDGSEVTQKIAGHIAELIPDGATMQMGIGAIPDAVLKYLFEKKDLGVHSELFSDGVMDLVEAGVITNDRKTLHQGKIVAGFIIGTKRLYDWVDDNPLIELHPTEYVNDPFVIAQNYRQIAIQLSMST